jgi:hypothetical protein
LRVAREPARGRIAGRVDYQALAFATDSSGRTLFDRHLGHDRSIIGAFGS